ncbi:MAG: hypothetical protein ACQKBY_05160 [Verrucomicrobiales bacterium]
MNLMKKEEMKLMKKVSLLCWLFLLGVLSAQEEQQAGIQVRCLNFENDSELPGTLYLHSPGPEGGAPGVPVKLKNYLNHERVTVIPGSADLIVTKQAGADSVKQAEDVVGRVKLKAGQKMLILLFMPGGEEGKSHVLAMDESLRAFPKGAIYMFNLSPLNLRLMLEKEVFDFKPGQQTLIEDPPVNDRYASSMRAFVYQVNHWKRIDTSFWPHPGNKRVIKIAYFNKQTQQIEIKGVRDISPPRS